MCTRCPHSRVDREIIVPPKEDGHPPKLLLRRTCNDCNAFLGDTPIGMKPKKERGSSKKVLAKRR